MLFGRRLVDGALFPLLALALAFTVRSEVNVVVLGCLNEAGVEISYPQRMLHRARMAVPDASRSG